MSAVLRKAYDALLAACLRLRRKYRSLKAENTRLRSRLGEVVKIEVEVPRRRDSPEDVEDHYADDRSPKSGACSDPGVSLLQYSDPEGWDSGVANRLSPAAVTSGPASAVPSIRASHVVPPVWTPLADAGWVPPSHGPVTERSMWARDQSVSEVQVEGHSGDNDESRARTADCAARHQEVLIQEDVQCADVSPVLSPAAASKSIGDQTKQEPLRHAPRQRRSRASGRARKWGKAAAGRASSTGGSSPSKAAEEPVPTRTDVVSWENGHPPPQGWGNGEIHGHVRAPPAAAQRCIKREAEPIKVEFGTLPRVRLLRRRSSGAGRGCPAWPKTRLGFDVSPSLTKPSRTAVTSEIIALSDDDFRDTPQFDSPALVPCHGSPWCPRTPPRWVTRRLASPAVASCRSLSGSGRRRKRRRLGSIALP